MSFQDYETVEDRLKRFWELYPGGRVDTVLVANEGDTVIFCAHVWRSAANSFPCSTGWAEEKRGSSKVNQSFCLENAETSAIGRALSNLSLNLGPRPSRNEMEKVDRESNQGKAPTKHIQEKFQATKIKNLINELSLDDKKALREKFEKEGLPNPIPDSLDNDTFNKISKILGEL